MSSVWDVESPSASVTVTSTEVGMLSPSKSKTDASLMEISPVAESMANGLSSATEYVSVSPASGSVPAAVAMTVPAAVFSATFTEVPSSK